MDRRGSSEDEPARPPSNPDVFDDDHEIDPDEDDFMPAVSDGFRPANTTGDSQNHDRYEPPQRHTSTSKPSEGDLRRTATRNSTAKVQDGRPPAMSTRGTSPPAPPSHRASISSTGSFATTSNGDNPFETGPSHPYGMYPQHTVGRTSSVVTASTVRQSQRPMSLRGPAHPYAMYSQSGLDNDDPPEELVHPPVPPIQTVIPVGFPGLSAGYHRVLGPDGEEQDIIGPDGHTEQLPPYTRYPEEGPTKASLAAEESVSRMLPAPSIVVDADDPFATPVSPLSAASVSAPALPSEPFLPTVTPARLPPQRPETQTGNAAYSTSVAPAPAQVPAEPSESSSASLLATEQSYSEKAEPSDSKIGWRKRKLWGRIPLGVAVLVLVLVFALAIALGGAIGAVIAKKHQGNKDQYNNGHSSGEPQPQITGSRGALFDATPIPTPSGLGLLPTGAFSLPLGIPMESNPGCMTQASQYSAWSCKLTFAPLTITINNTQTNDGYSQVASMKNGGTVPDGAILYGLQSPDLFLQPLQLVLDMDYKAYGPAYHFATRYDKVVILRSDELVPSGLKKRAEGKDSRQRFQVKPGDFPWYCFWNQTYIEGYVYVVDNSTAASFSGFPTQLPTGAPTASFDTSSFLAAYPTVAPSPPTGPSVTSFILAAVTPSPVVRRDAQSDASIPPRVPPYPRIVKIEERRLPDSPQPYCQRMVLLENGKIAPAQNGNGDASKILLQAVDPSYEEYYAAQATATSGSKRGIAAQRRSDPSDSCHCQWMFT